MCVILIRHPSVDMVVKVTVTCSWDSSPVRATGVCVGGGGGVDNGAVPIVGTTVVAKTHLPLSMHEVIYPASVVRERQRDHQLSPHPLSCPCSWEGVTP